MKYLNSYSNADPLFEKIESIVVDYYDIILESKLGDWLIAAPKIRRLQEKANQLRIRCARAEAMQKRQIDYALSRGMSVDSGRMWELLQNKIDAWEDTAREYENRAEEIAAGSEYLRKVRSVAKMKGVFKVNREKIAVAEAEERRELQKQNVILQRKIREDERILADKAESEKIRLEMAKERMKMQQAAVEASKPNSKANYFDNKKAASLRKSTVGQVLHSTILNSPA